jgi:hypothetical protein
MAFQKQIPLDKLGAGNIIISIIAAIISGVFSFEGARS